MKMKQKNQKKNLLQKNLKTRELTKNEKVLLSLLTVVILIWASFRFIITPQREKIEALKAEKIEYKGRIDEINNVLRKEEDINKEFIRLNDEKRIIVSKYFPTIDQAQIIYLLDDLMEHEDVSIVDLNFSRPSYEDIGGFQVRSMDISIPYNGNYEGIIDTVNSIDGSPRKILVDSLTMDRDSEAKLNGNIALKVYSLEGIVDTDSDIIYIASTSTGGKDSPFGKYNDYYVKNEEESKENDDGITSDSSSGDYGSSSDSGIVEDSGSSSDSSNHGGSSNGQNNGVQINPYINETLLDFENRNNYFLPSQPLVKGSVMQSNNAKLNKFSLRFEYDILAVGEENRAYVDISRNNISLKYPPNSIGMWLYSYDYSPITVGIGFKGQMGEEEFSPLTEGIGWTGWKYLEVSPPTDLSIYPLKVDKIYIEMPKNREDFGVILIDKLEAIYPRNAGEDGSDKSTTDYIFHVVARGDTIEKVSTKYYGNISKKNEILKLNEMNYGAILNEGKVLVLKKP